MFAKIFETAIGQVAVLAREHNGQPSIIYHFDAGTGVEVSPIQKFPDSLEGEESRDEAFNETTKESAEDFAKNFVDGMRFIFSEGEGGE
jgi:hypothetical protein